MVAGDIAGAAARARHAATLAVVAGDAALATEARTAVANAEFLLGEGDGDEEMAELEQAVRSETWRRPRSTLHQPSVALGVLLKWTDRLDQARTTLLRARDRFLRDGRERSIPFLLYHLAELECWAGNLDEAERHAAQASDVAVRTGQEAIRPFTLFATGLVHAIRGRIDDARRDAASGLKLARETSAAQATVLHHSLLGFVELTVGDPAAAHRALAPLVEGVLEVGLHEPGVLRYAGDAVEAMIGVGDVDRAAAFLDRFEDRARELRRAWPVAVSARSRGLLAAAHGDLSSATTSFRNALELYEELGHPLELGRTLLASGALERRMRQKAPARRSLERALELFQRLGAPPWGDRARAELSRISGRAPTPFDLTPTESKVADLVSAGATNQEVAARLFMSPKTVEWNLSRIYRKLGVRSRTELAALLREA